MLQNYGNSSVSLDKLGVSELTPGPATWNVEIFVQVLKELVCNSSIRESVEENRAGTCVKMWQKVCGS